MHFTLLLNLKQFTSAIKLYIIYKWKVFILLWHEYKYCTKCPSEVFRIAQFCTYCLNFFWGEDPQPPPPFHLYCPRMYLKKFRHFNTVKMGILTSHTSVWRRPFC